MGRRGCRPPMGRRRCNPSSPVACPSVGTACSGGCRRGGRVITVVDVDAAAAASAGGWPVRRPGCAGILRVWSAARSRRVQGPGRDGVHVDSRTAPGGLQGHEPRCCPPGAYPGAATPFEVVGAALLGAGYRRATDQGRRCRGGGRLAARGPRRGSGADRPVSGIVTEPARTPPRPHRPGKGGRCPRRSRPWAQRPARSCWPWPPRADPARAVGSREGLPRDPGGTPPPAPAPPAVWSNPGALPSLRGWPLSTSSPAASC